jgi:hypothetical protein
MKKKQKMRKVYYSHIEYGEVMIPDGLCGTEKMDYLLDLFERGKDFRVYDRGETIFNEGGKPEEYKVIKPNTPIILPEHYIPEDGETGVIFVVNGDLKCLLLQKVEGGVQATYQNDEDSEEITFKMS